MGTDTEFGAVPPWNDRKIIEKLREFNVFLTVPSSLHKSKNAAPGIIPRCGNFLFYNPNVNPPTIFLMISICSGRKWTISS